MTPETSPLHLCNPGFEAASLPFRQLGVLQAVELQLVDTVAARHGVTDPEILVGLAFAVRAPRMGHVGVDLAALPQQVDLRPPPGQEPSAGSPPPKPPLWPADPGGWRARVHGAAALVGAPGTTLPFVVQTLGGGQALLMTRRMWREQQRLAEALLALATAKLPAALQPGPVPPTPEDARATEGTNAAVRNALMRRFSVVTGGPGTGKTTVVRSLLIRLWREWPQLRVALAAPTGKASMRLRDAIAESGSAPEPEPQLADRLSALRPQTLHKLLGVRPDGTVRHDPAAPLPYDLIVVDEGSMIDLVLMRQLVEAIPAEARLILLGDRDQLASVEAGTVLADVVAAAFSPQPDPAQPLVACVTRLRHAWRTAHAPTLTRIAEALQSGETGLDAAFALLTAPENGEVRHVAPLDPTSLAEPELAELAAPYLEGYIATLGRALASHSADDAALHTDAFRRALLAAFDGYRILAAHRHGRMGVAGLERDMTRILRQRLQRLARRQEGAVAAQLASQHGFWLGQPLLITENAYEVGLMNGDVGLVLPSPHGLQAFFASGGGTPVAVPLVRLPPHTGALAMTVHKAQGSQFERVALVLAAADSPIQTRELVYTAITRARSRLDWLGSPAVLRAALARPVGRASGLRGLLGVE